MRRLQLSRCQKGATAPIADLSGEKEKRTATKSDATDSNKSRIEVADQVARGHSLGLKIYLLSNEVWVSSVGLKSAASAAGIRGGDRIVAFSGERIQPDKFPLLRRINAANTDTQGCIEIR